MDKIHRRRHGVVYAACMLILGLGAPFAQVQPDKPVQEQVVYIEFFGPPPSINEMVLDADAVVFGRILGSKQADADHPGKPGAWTRTGFRLRINEVFHTKSDHRIETEEIAVIQDGGDRPGVGQVGKRVVVSGFPALKPGEEYVLFLRQTAHGWEPPYGPDGVFQIQKGRVNTDGRSKVAQLQHGRAGKEFLSLVRNFGVGK